MAVLYGTKEDVIGLTGISPEKMGLADSATLDGLIDQWIAWVSNEITTRLREEVPADDARYPGLVGLAVRYVSKFVQKAVQSRTGHIVQQSETVLNYPDMSEIMTGIDIELRAYRKRRIDIYLSTPLEDDAP